MTAKACCAIIDIIPYERYNIYGAITHNVTHKAISYHSDCWLYMTVAPEVSDGGLPAPDLAPPPRP